MLQMKGISKSFPGVKALDDVTFSVKKGEIHALVGENGAGKSTLMKVLSGSYTADEGEIVIDGEKILNPNPALMIEKGVAVIYQELMLLKYRTVAENIFMGRYPKNKFGFVDYKKMRDDSIRILKELELNLDPDAVISDLNIAKRQMVEIAKAMSKNAKIIVMDEPTATLGEAELEGLFLTIRRLSKKGITFIYISHRLKEVFEICTSLTIMKDGAVVESGAVSDYDVNELVTKMVGRDVSNMYPANTRKPGEVILKVEGLTRKGKFSDISFNLRRGEILGIAGLVGAGRTEILRALIGADHYDSGTITIDGMEKKIKCPTDGINAKLGIVPEDRKGQGLFLKQNIIYNISIASLKQFISGIIINPVKERKTAKKFVDMFHIRPGHLDTTVVNMSGGNQQKLIISKWLTSNLKILLIDEPTRGIDVGSRQEIYAILNDLVLKGMSIIMVSSELPELLGMCDRIMVINEGRKTALVDRFDAKEELLMRYATCEVERPA